MTAAFKKSFTPWPIVSVVFLTLLIAVALTAIDTGQTTIGDGDITNELPPSVQMQFMRPDQLEASAREFPVVYVPFGLIEWHGRHLPLEMMP